MLNIFRYCFDKHFLRTYLIITNYLVRNGFSEKCKMFTDKDFILKVSQIYAGNAIITSNGGRLHASQTLISTVAVMTCFA